MIFCNCGQAMFINEPICSACKEYEKNIGKTVVKLRNILDKHSDHDIDILLKKLGKHYDEKI